MCGGLDQPDVPASHSNGSAGCCPSAAAIVRIETFARRRSAITIRSSSVKNRDEASASSTFRDRIPSTEVLRRPLEPKRAPGVFFNGNGLSIDVADAGASGTGWEIGVQGVQQCA